MDQEQSLLKQRLMWIVWPAFLMAGVMELLVFAMVDPDDMQWFGHRLEFSRQTIYTVSFFVFWFVTSLSGALTTLLAMPARDINHL